MILTKEPFNDLSSVNGKRPDLPKGSQILKMPWGPWWLCVMWTEGTQRS